MTPRSIGSAIRIVREFNEDGIACSLAYLPIPKRSRSLIQREIRQHERVLDRIAEEHVNSDITIKLQALGVRSSEELAREAVLRIVEKAARNRNFVWIDMELPETVDATIRIFREANARFHNTGICLQAYLERTDEDLAGVLSESVPVRLVKGFYDEHDIEPWSAVTRNYAQLMEYVLVHSSYPAIATHDLALIERAKEIIRERNIRNAEFQFFRSVRDDLARQLVSEGFHVRIYVPFGNLFRFLIAGAHTFDKWHQIQRLLGMRPTS